MTFLYNAVWWGSLFAIAAYPILVEVLLFSKFYDISSFSTATFVNSIGGSEELGTLQVKKSVTVKVFSNKFYCSHTHHLSLGKSLKKYEG